MGQQVGYENLAVSSSAVTFTGSTVTARARCAVIICETDNVRWRADGTSPTASVGSLLRRGASFILRGETNIKNIEFIRTSTDAVVHGAFFSDLNDALSYEGMYASSIVNLYDPADDTAIYAENELTTASSSAARRSLYTQSLMTVQGTSATQKWPIVMGSDASDFRTKNPSTIFGSDGNFGGTGAVAYRIPQVFKMIDAVAITAGSPPTVWDPSSGTKWRLMGWRLSSSANATLEFIDHSGTTVVAQTPLLAAAGIDVCDNIGNGIISATANNNLLLDVTANSTVSGMIWGTEE